MSVETKVMERPILFSGPMVKAILGGKKTMTRRVVKGNFAPDQFIREKYGSGYGWHWPNWKGKETLWTMTGAVGVAKDAGFDVHVKCPYGKPGDRLWIKSGYSTEYNPSRNETTWSSGGRFIQTHGNPISKTGKVKKDGNHPGMFMPSWLSAELRFPLLEITDVRVERLQEITEADAIAEGFEEKIRSQDFDPAVAGFYELWEKLNAERGKCKTCKGHGVVPAWSGSVGGGSLMQDAEDCPDCKGATTGFGWDANPWVWVVSFRRIDNER